MSTHKTLQQLLLITLLSFSHGLLAADKKAHWGYSGEEGPMHWGELSYDFSSCETGRRQSPIDIQRVKKEKLDKIAFHYSPSSINFINNGHTLQQNYDKGSYILVGGKRYELLQFHFHAPSEHSFKGVYRDMVAHLVHKAADGQLAVVAVTMQMSSRYSTKTINSLWKSLPMKAGDKEVSGKKINVADMLPKQRRYYQYSGSLTTPPCSEGVHWMVLEESMFVSHEQVERFMRLFPRSIRPTQPANGREVLFGGM